MDDGYLIQPSFPSSHPVWGGTRRIPLLEKYRRISIHPPRVGWDEPGGEAPSMGAISIHPPRVGWDI